MWKTVLRRVLIMIPQIIILSVLIFFLAKLMPGDPFKGMISPDMDPATVELMKAKAGLFDPLHEQYFDWVSNAVKGDFGRSVHYKMPVSTLIAGRAVNTFYLSLLSVLLTYAIAIPLGMYSGRYNGSAFDNIVVGYNFVSYSIPGFVFYLLAIVAFGYGLGWFPTGGTIGIGLTDGFARMFSRLHHMILPAICYSLLSTTGTVQYLRNEIIDAKSQDYVRTARSKGVPVDVVYRKHIFRNSILPIAAFFGFTITGLLGGSVMIETVFNYPGMGSLFIEAVGVRDYTVMTTLILLYGTLTLFGSLISDILMSVVDPRIRIE